MSNRGLILASPLILISAIINDNDKFRIFDYAGNQNRWSIFNIENVNGYHPAKLNNYQNIINKVNNSGFNIWPIGILKLLNVKYLILPYSDFTHPFFTKMITKPMYYFGNNHKFDGKLINMDVYKFENFLPRIYFAKHIKSIEKQKIYSEIIHDDFNPSEVSYLDKNNFALLYISIKYQPNK